MCALGIGQGEQLEGRQEVDPVMLDHVGHGGGMSGAVQREWSQFKASMEARMKRQGAEGA